MDSQWIIEKSFASCPFKVTIPQIEPLGLKKAISFSVIIKSKQHTNLMIRSLYLLDKAGDILERNKKVEVLDSYMIKKHVDYEFESSLLKFNTRISMLIFSDHGKKYMVEYLLKPSNTLELSQIQSADMSEQNKSEYRMLLKSANKTDQKEEIIEEINQKKSISPDLEDYMSALREEITYLKKEGGRKYKAVHGVFVGRYQYSYAYSFELESELYLADDAPVVVFISGQKYKATVFISDGTKVTLLFGLHFGSVIHTAFISVDPWKLLEALNEKLCKITKKDRIVMKLLNNGPNLAKSLKADQIPKGQNVAKEIAAHSDITMIWGPPGTGKTHTISEIAIENMKAGRTVLIVSHSNVSVDGVIKKIAEMLRKNNDNTYLKNGQVLRYGFIRDKELSRDKEATAFNYTLSKNQPLNEKMEQLIAKRKEIKSEKDPKIFEIEKEIKIVRNLLHDEIKKNTEKARIVATTISKVNIDPVFEDRKYDVVMFDEASMGYVPQILSAAALATKHFICVGDFRQLPPIALSEEGKPVLEKDIYSYLHIVGKDNKINYHPWLVMLNVQRRMTSGIADFSNKYIYENMLENYANIDKERDAIVERKPFAGSTINFIDLSGSYCAAYKNNDNSRFNILSALITLGTAFYAKKNGEDSIGIITPYAAQTRIIKAMLLDCGEEYNTEIMCSTVHQFQGSEKNVILFDAVESYPSQKVGWLMSKNDNHSLTRLINVAVTRAKGKLIVVAHNRFWNNMFEGSRHTLYLLLKHIMKNGKTIDFHEKQLSNYIADLHYGKSIKYYPDQEAYTDKIIADILNAKEKIIISIPDGNLHDDKTNDEIIRALKLICKKGVEVIAKTKFYPLLPDEWKSISKHSDNATFPLILIDNIILWYGLPLSRGQFKAKSISYNTVCNTVFRLTGEHTIEIIKGFTDLEMQVVDNHISPLTQKDSAANDEEGKEPSKFARFVKEHAKCEHCHAPVTLQRGYKKKYYVRCTECKKTKYLEKDLINQYIDINHVYCPKDGYKIRAKVGYYGLYIACDNNHFLKVEDIIE